MRPGPAPSELPRSRCQRQRILVIGPGEGHEKGGIEGEVGFFRQWSSAEIVLSDPLLGSPPPH
jgi:hypothetical protein